MTVSPRGATAVSTGEPVKGWLVMLLGGVVAWISGEAWSEARGTVEPFALALTFATLVLMTVLAKLIAGRLVRPWALGVAGTVGLGVPWFSLLALEWQGQGVWVPTALMLGATFLVVTGTAVGTRVVLNRWGER